MKSHFNRLGFTLIELIIVISIVAVLSSIVVIAINPPKLLQESRDLKRMSDLASIDKAINQLMGYAVTSSIFGGSPNIVYISIPDASSTCANLGLSSLPSGWSYSCSSQANYRNVNGTGWLPINFAALSIGSPISNLPIDPINQTSTSQYYTYVTGGSYELTATLESEKYADKSTQDGGIDPATLEIGSDLKLSPFVHGLVGYWNFDETGTTAIDKSGFGNNGTMFSSTTATDLHLASSSCKTGNRCVAFDGVNDYVDVGDHDIGQGVYNLTISVWFKLNVATTTSIRNLITYQQIAGNATAAMDVDRTTATGKLKFSVRNSNNLTVSSLSNQRFESINWTNMVGVYDGSLVKIYLDGDLQAAPPALSGLTLNNGGKLQFGVQNSVFGFAGFINEIRIYSRALSALEIKAIYDATK